MEKDNENNCKSEQVAKTSSNIINNETEKKEGWAQFKRPKTYKACCISKVVRVFVPHRL